MCENLSQKEKADQRNSSIKKQQRTKKTPHRVQPERKFKIKKGNKYKQNSSDEVCHQLHSQLRSALFYLMNREITISSQTKAGDHRETLVTAHLLSRRRQCSSVA